MPFQQLLTDVATGIWEDQFEIGADQHPLSSGADWSLSKRTLRGGLSDGVDLVELNNGHLSLSILPTRGMSIWKGRCGKLDLGWSNPISRPVHPHFVETHDRGGLGWLNGFNEWLCRCGLAWHGPPEPPLTLHGRIANRPAHRVEFESTDEPATLTVRGEVDEAGMFGPALRMTSTYTTWPDSNRFRLTDRIENFGGTPQPFEILYHINTGRPFLEEGSRFSASVQEMAPRDSRSAEGIEDWTRYSGPIPGFVEQAYYMQLIADDQGLSRVLLQNAGGACGLALEIDTASLPYFTLWKNTQAEADGYVTGLEPCTSFPNVHSFEEFNGRLIELQPGEHRDLSFAVTVLEDADAVRQMADEITRLQDRASPSIRRKPDPRWSPAS